MSWHKDSIHIPQFNLTPQNMYMFNAQWPIVPPTNINFGTTNQSFPMMFTGVSEVSNNCNQEVVHENIQAKRKSLEDEDVGYPQKVLITEEKMAAKMRDMHISPNYVTHTDTDQYFDSIDLEENGNHSNENQLSLYICKELQNIEKFPSIVPHSLVPHSDPSKALVLWRPPVSMYNLNQTSEDENSSSVVITDVTDSYIDPITGDILQENPEPLVYKNNDMDVMDVMDM